MMEPDEALQLTVAFLARSQRDDEPSLSMEDAWEGFTHSSREVRCCTEL